MKLKKILVPLTLCLFLSGCGDFGEETKNLPDNPSGEVTHNSFDDKSSFLTDQEPASLDEDFISEHIDVDSFNSESSDVKNSSNSLNKDFTETDKGISADLTENEKEYNKQKNSVDSDISSMENNNTEKYNKDVNDMNTELNKKETEYNEKVSEFTSEED